VVVAKLYVFSVILPFPNEKRNATNTKIIPFIHNLSKSIAVDIQFSSCTSGEKASCTV
jgi:hypothetical protein